VRITDSARGADSRSTDSKTDATATTAGGVWAAARPRTRRRLLQGGAAALTLLLAVGGVLAAGAASFGQDLRAGDQLLPGVTIAGVEVGGSTRTEAAEAVQERLADHLDGEVVLVHEVGTWSTTPRALGATTDLDQVLADAFAGTTEASLTQLVATRWFGSTSQLALDVTVQHDPDAQAALVAEIVADVDRSPTEATVVWGEGEALVTAHRDGRAVDTAALATALATALEDAAATTPIEVAVPTDVVPAALTTEAATRAGAAAEAAVDAALDRPVTVAFEERAFTVTARDAGARVDGDAVISAALAGPDTEPDVALSLTSDDLTGPVAAIAAEVDLAAASATGAYRGGAVQVTPGRLGRSVDRATTRELLLTALVEGGDEVPLPVSTVQPAVTSANFDTTLVVRQRDRIVELHRAGALVRSWPVAVGTGGSPTPTGTFTVGAKRFEPTWVNPAQDRWGADLPARVGPGPDNPLGLRALNWNRVGGGDTLIRFHGTPNEDSIGEAASNGCVRMFNADVVELYDLVPSGAMIISIG